MLSRLSFETLEPNISASVIRPHLSATVKKNQDEIKDDTKLLDYK